MYFYIQISFDSIFFPIFDTCLQNIFFHKGSFSENSLPAINTHFILFTFCQYFFLYYILVSAFYQVESSLSRCALAKGTSTRSAAPDNYPLWTPRSRHPKDHHHYPPDARTYSHLFGGRQNLSGKAYDSRKEEKPGEQH